MLPGMAPSPVPYLPGRAFPAALLAGTVDRAEESHRDGRGVFNPLRSNRAEFYSFFLFHHRPAAGRGCGQPDLALPGARAHEPADVHHGRDQFRAAPGAGGGRQVLLPRRSGAAVFLYGFALLYGATGTTNLNAIHESFTRGISTMAIAGLILSLLWPVLQDCRRADALLHGGRLPGRLSAGVAAMLAFVPKTAGFPGHAADPGDGRLELGPAPASLPEPLRLLLWVIAALTMTVGNVLAVIQSSAKRTLAYSSIAHSGYMLVGVIAGPGTVHSPATAFRPSCSICSATA